MTMKLIQIIQAHGARAVALPDGGLLCEVLYAGAGFPDTACEFYGPYWERVEPSINAVRDWLGY